MATEAIPVAIEGPDVPTTLGEVVDFATRGVGVQVPVSGERFRLGQQLRARVGAVGEPIACQVVAVRSVTGGALVGLGLTGPADEPGRAHLRQLVAELFAPRYWR